jgi:hypothetical protein
MQRPVILVVALVALLSGALGACGPWSAVGAGSPTPSPTLTPPSHYTVTLSPLNGTRVSGTMRLDLTGNVLAITLHVSGLEPNHEHYLHIHGNPGSTVACPSRAAAGPSGMLTVQQGLAVVGPIVLDLQPYPQVTGLGPVDWSQVYTLSAGELAVLSPLTAHVVVLHGMTYQGVYDRALFVACGPIRAA